jgi:alkylation response protein AidB-like acyl-CoA dehydrogenase
MENNKALKSGEFLVRESDPAKVFIPEEFNEEQRMIAQTCQDFLDTEVFPVLERIDHQEPGLMPVLLKKAGQLGLLAISIPEQYEGFGQNFLTSMLASEVLGSGFSFAVAYSAHTGIGTCPLLYYGSEELKKKYISKLGSGEYTASYCLTEPNAGSDANSGKTSATLSADEKYYIMNGQKMWITNGGFADILTVFAKIDNDRCLSAFLVEANSPGVVRNPEEKKMGIKGSSTVQLFFNDVKVPVENLIGERGEGYRIALNILHMGRIKLGANVLGASRKAINESVAYANERKQFGAKIASFGSIKYKLAEQVIRHFTTESSVYRVSKNIDDAITELIAGGMAKEKATIEGIAQYSIEAAFLKVFSSEVLDYIVDEAVQIFGGMGYSAETLVEKSYRDSRINRIFEGTNEINRLLVVDLTIKKSKKGEYNLFGPAEAILQSLKNLKDAKPADAGYYEQRQHYVKNFKKAVLMMIASVSKFFDRKLPFEQEVLNNISDMIMQVYAAESTFLRVQKLEGIKGGASIQVYRDILDVFLYEAAAIVLKAGMDAIHSFATGNDYEDLTHALSLFTRTQPVNIKEARRRIADKLIEDNRYAF